MRRLLSSSVPYSDCECAAMGSLPRPICSDFLSPSEEDWKPGVPENRHGFFDALRPFRLARKYGRGNES